MNAKQLISTVALLAATGAVFAQQTEWVAADANFVSTKTRAEVRAELNQAYADGTIGTMARDGVDAVQLARNAAAGKSRAAVIAELNQAYADGTTGTMVRDGAEPIRFAGTRSRDEVKREAQLANQNTFHKSGS
ncbi:MAG TPA: DUF4148 domain-containing protein [Burkholderiaceae bacterium]|nr:DUF4148 domain-containing protein [Burkholderiaceae bacterium]